MKIFRKILLCTLAAFLIPAAAAALPGALASRADFLSPVVLRFFITPDPGTIGLPVYYTVRVDTMGSPDPPTGTVTLMDGTDQIGIAPVNNSIANFVAIARVLGPHTITAIYSGDSNFSEATSSTSTSVKKASTSVTLTSSLNPSTYGEAVTYTALITPEPPFPLVTGTVELMEGSSQIASADVSDSKATFDISSLGAGNHLLTAVYDGDSNFSGSTSPAVSQQVGKRATDVALVSSTNPSVYGAPVTFTANVLPAGATGSVTFYDGPTALGISSLSGGTAALTTGALAVGSHSLTAVYGGDGNYLTSTSGVLTQTVTHGSIYTVHYIDLMTGRPVAPDTVGGGSPGDTVTLRYHPVGGFCVTAPASQTITLAAGSGNAVTFRYLSATVLLAVMAICLLLPILLGIAAFLLLP